MPVREADTAVVVSLAAVVAVALHSAVAAVVASVAAALRRVRVSAAVRVSETSLAVQEAAVSQLALHLPVVPLHSLAEDDLSPGLVAIGTATGTGADGTGVVRAMASEQAWRSVPSAPRTITAIRTITMTPTLMRRTPMLTAENMLLSRRVATRLPTARPGSNRMTRHPVPTSGMTARGTPARNGRAFS